LSPKVERNIVIIGPLQVAIGHNVPATDNPIPHIHACSSQNTHFKRCNKLDEVAEKSPQQQLKVT
jgi:hypothetical protein